MKFQCSHCQSDLETDQQWVGYQVNCPICGKDVLISPPVAHGPSVRKVEPNPKTTNSSPKIARSKPAASSGDADPAKGGGLGKFILVMLLLTGGGFGFACYHFDESPPKAWQRLVDYVEKKIQPPTPAPIAKAAPIPKPVSPPPPQAAVLRPPTHAIVAPTPPPPADPLAWILTHLDESPKELTLLVDTEFPIIYNGHATGSGNVPAGSVVQIVQITSETQIVTVACSAYGNSTVHVPIQSTDLLDRTKAAMAKAEAGAKAAREKEIVVAVPPELHAASEPSTPVATVPPAPPDSTAEQEPAKSGAFVHPGLLHNDDDFRRIKENLEIEPWHSGWQKLIANRHASLDWTPHPVAVVVRGRDRLATQPENYGNLFNDIAAAYACALRWRISGDRRYADKSVEIMNAWSSTLTRITGSTDACLAGGIYGYEFANAAEIMRSYEGWKSEDFARFQGMMMNVFYPMNHDFLVRHNGTRIDHYWCNWDACNMDSMIAIGVLCDRRDIYNEAVDYYKYGKGNGAIAQAVYYIHPDGLGQWQESGRDQGHSEMGIGLIGAFCEMAWKQGDDLYGYDNNRFLAGCEYVAKYNMGEDVPYKPFSDSLATQDVIGAGGRGGQRPIWELIYNHYVKLKGLSAPYTTKAAESVRPEGGGGDYGPNSGGFDQFGYGTLTATLK